MPEEEAIEKFYQLDRTIIGINANNRGWADSMGSYLSLPQVSGGAPADITLALHETGAEMLDELIRLPGSEYKSREGTLLVDRPVPYRVYIKGEQHWSDYSGFGRVWADRFSGSAKAARSNDSGISPVYADIIFGYNVIIGLLFKSGYNSVHASCVQVGGNGVLFTGKSGSGKSTAAYAMLRKGHPILADDRVLLQRADDYRAVSITDVIKLDRTAVSAFFPELRGTPPLHQVGKECYHKVSATQRMPYINSTTVKYLMIFQRTGASRSRLEMVNPSRVVGDLFPVTMGGFNSLAMEKKFTFLMNLLLHLKCYRVYFGTDMDDFAKLIEDVTANERAGSAEAAEKKIYPSRSLKKTGQ